MMPTILWYFYFWLYATYSIFLFIPVIPLSLPAFHTLRDRYIHHTVSIWSRRLIHAAGGKITIIGKQNLPPSGNICFVANHQGAFDIPIIIGYLPRLVGFIAKKELSLLPIINLWMKGIGCIFINRANRRAALDSIKQGVEQIKNGRAMIIFPEGTRSQGPQMNRFRQGSLKLPIRSGAIIVPITISGSYKLKEQHNRIQPGDVKVSIHKPVNSSSYREDETQKLSQHLFDVINRAL